MERRQADPLQEREGQISICGEMEGMGKGAQLQGREWIVQIGAALAYGLAYCAIRPFSDAHWSLTSGLRFTCLLLIPYRYWIALAMGEVVPLTYFMFKGVGLFGFMTAVIWSVPPIMVAMPLVWFCRSRLGLFPTRRGVDLKVLLICSFATSLIWASVTYAGFLTATDPSTHANSAMFAGCFVGSYVAILTVSTWPLFARAARSGRSLREMIKDSIASPLGFDTVFYALPTLLVIACISSLAGAATAAILQVSLLLPVAWLTFKYGWRGAAASGPLAVACVCLLTLSVPDPVVIQTQLFLTVASFAVHMHLSS